MLLNKSKTEQRRSEKKVKSLLIEGEKYNNDDLNKKADIMEKCEDSVTIMR